MKYQINLIGQKGNKKGAFNKVNYFFFNYFRYILVITQLVVISVLFFRFTIDQSIIDLKESISQQEEVLKAVKPILDETQRIDAKLKKAKIILGDQDVFQRQLDYLAPKFPESMFLSTLVFTKDSVQMEGKIINPSQLQSFFNKIKIENKYADVSLGDIQKGNEGFLFSMSLNGFKKSNNGK